MTVVSQEYFQISCLFIRNQIKTELRFFLSAGPFVIQRFSPTRREKFLERNALVIQATLGCCSFKICLCQNVEMLECQSRNDK
jgi:hypothetical protein